MEEEEDKECFRLFHKLLDCIRINNEGFDMNSSCEYFRNHAQSITSISGKVREFVLMILTLKALVGSALLSSASPVYIQELTRCIEAFEAEKNWCMMKETLVYLPTTRLYMETIKYDLVQYNTHDCMYVLFLRCITFRETDVAKASDIIYEFLRPSLKRTLSIVPQVKWTFNGNPYMSITWIVALPKYALDSITGYRRSLLNEVWNDHFGGPGWKNVKSKSLMDYMRKLSNSKGGNSLKRFVSKTSSFFELDDTVFAKFSEDNEVYIRRSVFSLSALLVLALIVFVVLFFYRRWRE